MRLIDADIFNNFDYSSFFGALTEDAVQGMETVLTFIDKAPTVDAVSVRHGHWIEANDNDGMDYECSNRKCKCRISYNGAKVSGDFNYCPNCGAKMDEVD